MFLIIINVEFFLLFFMEMMMFFLSDFLMNRKLENINLN